MLRSRIGRQFADPQGALGRLAGMVMAHRGSNRRRNAWTVEQLDIQPIDEVLEIGYGPGVAIRQAASLAVGGHVVGVDRSQVMGQQATRRNRPAVTAGRVTLLTGTVTDLPDTWAGRFTKAFCVNVFMFWPDPVAVLREIGRYLAPGATLALTTQPRADEHSRQAGLRMAEALKAAGFADIDIRFLRLRPVTAVCVLGMHPQYLEFERESAQSGSR